MSKLKKLREQQNRTQEELSQKSGISVRTIQRIESGQAPKGYTLRVLAKTLGVQEQELLGKKVDTEHKKEEKAAQEMVTDDAERPDFSKIKLLNLSSLPFVVLPLFNILVPLILMYTLKLKSPLTKQIVSLQIMFTILAPIVFLVGILLKVGNQFTMVIMIMIVLSNVYLILRNTMELDRNQQLRYKLNFSIL